MENRMSAQSEGRLGAWTAARRVALAWLVLGLQISATWALHRAAPPSIDQGVEFTVPGLQECSADAQGRLDVNCMARRTAQVEEYLLHHDVPDADRGHGPVIWIEALLSLVGGALAFALSRSRPEFAFAVTIYLIGFMAAALDAPSFVGLLVAACLLAIRRHFRRLAT
jgi:hypothetical protein